MLLRSVADERFALRVPANFKLAGAAPLLCAITIRKVNEASERLLKSDVKYRISTDMASLKSQ